MDFCYDGVNYSGSACTGSLVASKKGLLTAVGSSVSATRFLSFDNVGRVKTSSQDTDGDVHSFSYTYNDAGGLETQAYPEGLDVRSCYDGAGRLSSVNDEAVGGVTYAGAITYAPHGAMTNADLGNGYKEMATFNNRLQPEYMWLACTAQVPAGCIYDPWKIELKYNSVSGTIDNNGNLRFHLLQIPDPNNDFEGDGLKQRYTYDALNRLQKVEEYFRNEPGNIHWSRNYTYDQYGNRAATGQDVFVDTPQDTNQFTASTNRLKSTWATYDNAGNVLVFKPDGFEWSASYDAENKQVAYCSGIETSVCHLQSAAAKTTYHYDGQGNRVKKVVKDAGSTVYVYDAFGKLASEYSNLGQLGPKGTLYRTADHLGSTRAVTDSSGNVVLRRDFFPFGEEMIASTTLHRSQYPAYNQPTGFNQQFTGQERNTESDFDYFGARYYASPMARFLSVDPSNAGAVTGDS